MTEFNTYVVFQKLSDLPDGAHINLSDMVRNYEMNIVRQRSTQVTVQASDEEIERLKHDHPDLSVTKQVFYRQAS